MKNSVIRRDSAVFLLFCGDKTVYAKLLMI